MNLVDTLNSLTPDEIDQMWADGTVPGTDLEIDQDALDVEVADFNDGNTVITTDGQRAEWGGGLWHSR